MKRLALVVSVLGLTSIAHAADMPRKAAVPSAWSWEGWYLGLHTGAALRISKVSDPYGSSIFGDSVRTPGFLLGGQIGYNWQQPGSKWVYGLEADVSWVDADGTNTCFAANGLLTSSNCHASPDFTGTFTGRIGYAAGAAGRTLLYVRRRRRAAQQARRDDELRLRRLPDQHDVRKPDHVGMDRRRRCRAGGVAGVVGQARIWLPEFRQRKPQHPGDVFDDARRAPRRLRWRIRSSSAPDSVPSANWNRRAQGVPWRFFGCRPPL